MPSRWQCVIRLSKQGCFNICVIYLLIQLVTVKLLILELILNINQWPSNNGQGILLTNPFFNFFINVEIVAKKMNANLFFCSHHYYVLR